MTSLPDMPATRSSVSNFGCKEMGLYFWTGNSNAECTHYVGQTFKAPATGSLISIKIFISLVFSPANLVLTVYEFDAPASAWKQKLAEAARPIEKTEESQWVEFTLTNAQVKKDAFYGFKITTTGNSGLVAIAECPLSTIDPYPDGMQWTGTSLRQEGSFHKDFDLAFEGTIG